MNSSPLQFRWTGDSFEPVSPQVARIADERYVIGEVYRLAEMRERTEKSHRHFFATIHEGWLQLPERITRFPTSEHLRHYALIKAGFCHSQSIVCLSPAEAVKIASFMRPNDPFAVIEVDGRTITRFTARSQSYDEMDAATFQQAKEKVLEIIASMIGITVQQLARNAARAA